MRDASLDEFVSGDGSEEEDTDAGAGTDQSEEVEAASGAADDGETPEEESTGEESTLTVEPATPTYDWSPEGAACAACGAVVETRWQDEGVGLVCPDCKEW